MSELLLSTLKPSDIDLQYTYTVDVVLRVYNAVIQKRSNEIDGAIFKIKILQSVGLAVSKHTSKKSGPKTRLYSCLDVYSQFRP